MRRLRGTLTLEVLVKFSKAGLATFSLGRMIWRSLSFIADREGQSEL